MKKRGETDIMDNQTLNPQVSEQPSSKASNNKKKSSKVSNIFIILLIIVGAGGYLVYNFFFVKKPVISINGYEITMSTSLQDLYDNGFILCTSTGKELKSSAAEKFKGKTLDYNYYDVGIKREGSSYAALTGVSVKLGNFSTTEKSINDCTMYSIQYIPFDQDKYEDIKVLVMGESFKGEDIDSAAAKIKKAGFPFKEKEIDEFVSEFKAGKDSRLYDVNGKNRFEVNSNAGKFKDDSAIYSISFTNDATVKFER